MDVPINLNCTKKNLTTNCDFNLDIWGVQIPRCTSSNGSITQTFGATQVLGYRHLDEGKSVCPQKVKKRQLDKCVLEIAQLTVFYYMHKRCSNYNVHLEIPDLIVAIFKPYYQIRYLKRHSWTVFG